ncbi:rhomboid family intramembrane serine protease [Mycolicibacillus koreensis]|nr:rhomboid family intramembrane serine protease [Mycolicibacillus koreensis]
MGVSDVSRTPTPGSAPASRRSGWQTGALLVLGFVAVLYAVELADELSGHRFDDHGIRPLRADGLWGVLFAPLLHANWAHLLANTGPLVVLGLLLALNGVGRLIAATAIVWLVGGLGTWLIGDLGACRLPSDHIGASTIIFGWLTFLIVFGFLARRGWQIAVGVLTLIGYGGTLWGAVPVLDRCDGVSWQGHLCGALAGVLAAYLLSRPERRARRHGPVTSGAPR